MPVDSTRFREAMGRFATGVTVVTLPGPQHPHGITVNAFTSVSLDPPLVLVCLDHDTTAHELLSEGRADGFAVTVLAADQQHLGEYFADMSTLEVDPFETETTRIEASGGPIFEDGLAGLDCALRSSYSEGDHTIYIGEVGMAEVFDPEGDALTYFGGWGTLSPADR